MDADKGSLEYGTRRIDYEILFVDRKTLEIAVHPDSKVIVRAPVKAPLDKINSKVTKRARWIHKQLDYFSRFEPRTTPRAFISGETHLYLGRQYRLKVKKGTQNNIKLARGIFWITCKKRTDSVAIRELLDAWYRARATEIFNECLDECMNKFKRQGFRTPRLRIAHLKKRWGSLSASGLLSINIDLIRAPRECIEYVVTHELCHQKIHNHGPGYYKLLDLLMPDWAVRKHRLELKLA